MRIRNTAGVMVSGLALVLGASLGVSSTAGAAEADTPAAAVAKRALADAKAALDGKGKKQNVTMKLRDLWLNQHALRGGDAAEARSILARPTSPDDDWYYGDGVDVETRCDDNMCLHWAESGDQATTPEFADATFEAMGHVAQKYIDAGYKPTLPDEGQGGSNLPDIYIADIGSYAYGYCTSDADDFTDGFAVYAYCVLDNDYSPEEFPTNTPIGNMQVTAAHEYFHAVQYAYDAMDDTWIYEAPATWAEDEVYDDVNDNWNYLPYGQMGDPSASQNYDGEGPGVSLDYGYFAYGNWIFFRYLSENFPQAEGGMATIVRQIWENLDTTEGTNRYSLQAVSKALADRGTSMGKVYGDFAVANNTPALSYDEGEDYPYPAYAFETVHLTKKKKAVSRSVVLDHLTSGTGAFLPFANGYQLRVELDMTEKKKGSRGAVTTYLNNGKVKVKWVKLNKKGDGTVKVPFAKDKVAGVEVTVVNASTAMKDCETDTDWLYSCGGFGKYENQKAKIAVKAVK